MYVSNATRAKLIIVHIHVLETDNEQPKIKYLGSIGGSHRYVLSDNLSGINMYNAYLNGEWIILSA